MNIYCNFKPLEGCLHGQKPNTKYRPIVFKFVTIGLNVSNPIGYRLWWYTRKGGRHIDLII